MSSSTNYDQSGNQLDKDAEIERSKPTFPIVLSCSEVINIVACSCMAAVFQGHEHTHTEVSRFQNTAKLLDKLILFMYTDDWRI